MIPTGTSVRLATDDEVLDQTVAFVVTGEGDWTESGERVPNNHVQVEVNLVHPNLGGIRHRTIIESSDIDEVFC